jgi:hypothetical protein
MKEVKTLKVFSLIGFFIALYLPIYTAVISAFGISGSISINITNLGLSLIMQIAMLVTVLFGLFGNFVRLSLQKASDIVVIVLFAIQIGLIMIAKDSVESYGLGFLTMIVTLAIYGVSAFAPSLALKGYQAVGNVLHKVGHQLVQTFGDAKQPEPVQEVTAEPVVESIEPSKEE